MSARDGWALVFLGSLVLYVNAVNHGLDDPWRFAFVVAMGASFMWSRR